MTTRRITPHKGGRTARIPSGWILPETLRRIHEAKRERGVSFADLIEEKFAGGNMDTVTCPRCGYEVKIDETGVGLCERDQIWVKPASYGANSGVFASNYDVVEAQEKYASKK